MTLQQLLARGVIFILLMAWITFLIGIVAPGLLSQPLYLASLAFLATVCLVVIAAALFWAINNL